ncbi:MULTISPECIES: hypothetical protein [Paracoccus]|uniref:hypothetical protein n=1 Tax=Paracoccus TaxID=265 RepID=UPI000FD763F0|nr:MULTISPECIES: hypothetical protein [Paracoccus]AZY93035.1 hypothetical protein EOJ32_04600 [Paracoccus sp. Arc7-R13]TNC05965.1 hypothetical protein FHD68_02495 [Paracoccus marcusii]
MSWRVENACADRRFGSAARKQIIMFLANKASDDGSGIWCSKGTIQRHTELGESTVKRTISDFINEGILVETGRRPCKNGFTVVYSIVLARVHALESSAELSSKAGVTVNPVRCGRATGSTVAGVPGPPWTPNHPTTIQEPPTRIGVKEAEDDFEKVWVAFPEDRRRGKPACIEYFRAALATGFQPAEIRYAAQSYAQETSGFTRSKVSFADNWFRQERWRASIETRRIQDTVSKADAEASLDEQRARMAGWVKSRSALCRHITKAQRQMLIARGVVTIEELVAAGLRP